LGAEARRAREFVLAKRFLEWVDDPPEAATGLGPGRHRAACWAQGDDSIDSHVRDTQDAGAGLVDEHTARFIAERTAPRPSSGWWAGRAVHADPTARWACT
jgi:hypothetical protein